MIVCIDCFKLFQTISNKNKTCNGPGGQAESENRMWHHAQTSRRKKIFFIFFERIIKHLRRSVATHGVPQMTVDPSPTHCRFPADTRLTSHRFWSLKLADLWDSFHKATTSIHLFAINFTKFKHSFERDSSHYEFIVDLFFLG